MLESPSLPKGVVRLNGTVNYQSQPNRPLLETVSLVGNVSSNELQVATESVRTTVRDIKAHYTLYHGNAVIEGLHAQVMGGTVDGRMTVRDITGAQAGQFQAALQGVSLDQLELLSHSRPLEQARLTGRVNAGTRGSWARNIKNLQAHADATIQ